MHYSELRKGDYIIPEVVEAEVRCPRDEPRYRLESLKLAQEISRYFECERDEVVTVRIEQGGIRILTDSEASDYNHASFESGVLKMRRSHRRNLGVDVSNLEESEVRDHRRVLTSQAAQLSAVGEARRHYPSLVPVRRQTPTMIGA